MADAKAAATRDDLAGKGVMGFGDHLEELRACCIRALVGMVVATCASLAFADNILEFILRPLIVVLRVHNLRTEIQALSPPDTFMTYMKMAILSGAIISMPWILAQIWRFVSIGLYASERRFLRMVTPASILLFFGGVAFMYYFALPIVLNFFVSFSQKITVSDAQPNLMQRWMLGTSTEGGGSEAPALESGTETKIPLLAKDPVDPPEGAVWINTSRKLVCVQTTVGVLTAPLQQGDTATPVTSQFGLNYYISFVLMLSLAFGLAFELPLVILFLTSMHIVEVERLAKARRYIIVGIFVVAAVLTPPDVISQLLLAIPMLALFEGALVAARMVNSPK